MQNRFDLLVTDVMPIYMIMPRYSHNYAQFCQLLNSNLFTHCRKLMLLREATSETYVIGSSFSYIFLCDVFLFAFIFQIYKPKNQKIPCCNLFNFILLSLSDITFASGRKGIDNPFIALVARFLFVCVRTRDF